MTLSKCASIAIALGVTSTVAVGWHSDTHVPHSNLFPNPLLPSIPTSHLQAACCQLQPHHPLAGVDRGGRLFMPLCSCQQTQGSTHEEASALWGVLVVLLVDVCDALTGSRSLRLDLQLCSRVGDVDQLMLMRIRSCACHLPSCGIT